MKSEKQKMLDNELYRADDGELAEGRSRARQLTSDYNNLKESESEKRTPILRDLFGSIGEYVEINPPFRCDYGFNIHIENNLYMNCGCIILDCNKVSIGNDVQIGPNVQIYTAYHPTDPKTRKSGKEIAAPISIMDNVWIGGSVIICPGVTIGKNSVIGAGSVVTKNVPDNVIAAGNPSRVMRKI